MISSSRLMLVICLWYILPLSTLASDRIQERDMPDLCDITPTDESPVRIRQHCLSTRSSVSWWWNNMMTSSQGNIFCVTGLFVRGIHRSPLNSPRKGQWRGALILSLIWAWTNDRVNKRDAGDFIRQRAHYDIGVMMIHSKLSLGYGEILR